MPCTRRASSVSPSPQIGVAVEPGATALARIPYRPNSAATARVNASIAPLLAEYAARFRQPRCAFPEDTDTIDPDWRRIMLLAAARVHKKTPVALMRFTLSHSSRVVSTR